MQGRAAKQALQTAAMGKGGGGAEVASRWALWKCWGAGPLWEILLQAFKEAISVTQISLLTL